MTKLLTIRPSTDHVALILSDAKGLPVGLLAINDPALLDSIVAELQAARVAVWGGAVALRVDELIEAMKRDLE